MNREKHAEMERPCSELSCFYLRKRNLSTAAEFLWYFTRGVSLFDLKHRELACQKRRRGESKWKVTFSPKRVKIDLPAQVLNAVNVERSKPKRLDLSIVQKNVRARLRVACFSASRADTRR